MASPSAEVKAAAAAAAGNSQSQVSRSAQVARRALVVDSNKELSVLRRWWNGLTFSSLGPLMTADADKVTAADLGPCSTSETAVATLRAFDAAMESHTAKAKAVAEASGEPPVPVKLINVTQEAAGRGTLILATSLNLLASVLALSIPVLFSELLTSLADPSVPNARLWLYAVGFFVLPILVSLSMQHSMYFAQLHVIRTRAAVSAAVYRKALAVDLSQRKSGDLELNVGTIVNLLSTDAEMLAGGSRYIAQLVGMPVLIIVAVVLLYLEVEWASLIGLAVMLAMGPLNANMMKKIYALYFKKMAVADERMRIVNELLNGIRIIKYYAWERPFAAKINRIRIGEMKILLSFNYYVMVAFTVLSSSTVIVMTLVVFLVYTLVVDGTLTPASAFTTIQLFTLIQDPLTQLPLAAVGYLQATAAGNRVNAFLTAGELPPGDKPDPKCAHADENAGIAIHVRHAKFEWPPEETDAAASAAASKDETVNPAADGGSPTAEPPADVAEVAVQIDGVDAAEPKGVDDVESKGEAKAADAGASGKKVVSLEIRDLAIKKGEFLAVVGKVGSYKSSLLAALLGDMPRVAPDVGGAGAGGAAGAGSTHNHHGRVDVYGKVGYVAQQSWICNMTLRENILFESPWDADRYRRVKTACQLDADVEALEGGDEAEIGERGITLSGGQKARVALARACYAKGCDIIVADDPLAAVDAHVGEALFTKVFVELLAGKTRVLVTNSLRHLQHVDRVLVMHEGRIAQLGKYETLVAHNGPLRQLVEGSVLANDDGEGSDGEYVDDYNDYESVDDEDVDVVPGVRMRSLSTASAGSRGRTDSLSRSRTMSKARRRTRSRIKSRGRTMTGSRKASDTGSSTKQQEAGQLTEDEQSAKGNIPFSTYTFFAAAFGTVTLLVSSIAGLLFQGSQVVSIFWLAEWSASVGEETKFIVGYAVINAISVLASSAQGVAIARGCNNVAVTLHDKLLNIVLRRPTDFFDTTPIGRVITRFSKDMNAVDTGVGRILAMTVSAAMALVRVLTTMAISTKGVLLIMLLPVLLVYRSTANYARKVTVLLQRLDSLSRAPVFASFTETLHGISTIRAFGRQRQSIKRNYKLLDANNRPFFLKNIAMLWMGVRLDFLGSVVSFSVAALVVASRTSGWDLLPVAWAAVALTAAQQLTKALQMVVMLGTYMESEMANVQRVQRYIEDTDNVEADVDNDETYPGPREQWPSQGVLELHDVRMRYRDGPLVLKGITAKLRAGEKVGVVGRTGSGKSSLIAALFRMTEPEAGKIMLDGIDVSTLGLSVLRSRVAIVPQEPTLFSASLRYNCDPLEEFDDSDIWDVLRQVKLEAFVKSQENKLKMEVTEGGANLSVGQRQLVCLARALLHKPKVCVFDEATASVDQSTDALIQSMIRTAFADATVLTVAHRLETILDSDRILALDDGHVAEFDTPQALLSNPDSLLTGLVEAAGPEVAAKLRAIAAGGPAGASAAVAAVVHAGVPPTVPEV